MAAVQILDLLLVKYSTEVKEMGEFQKFGTFYKVEMFNNLEHT